VITFARSRECAHLESLGSEALTYRNKKELESILKNFKRGEAGKTAYHDYADPRTVMEIFRRIFLF
jgi:meiotically up-regulated gene 157 (Mug157) protein